MTKTPQPNTQRAKIRKLRAGDLHEQLRRFVERGRALDVEFLLHLEEFDRRRQYERFGKPSLWAYLREELGLLECAALRRIRTVRILRRFPQVADFLRDGRLWMTTLVILDEILTEENADDLFASASGKSKGDVEYLVACMKAPVVQAGAVVEELSRAPIVPAPADVVSMRAAELRALRTDGLAGREKPAAEPLAPNGSAGRGESAVGAAMATNGAALATAADSVGSTGSVGAGEARDDAQVLLAPQRPAWNQVRPVSKNQFRITLNVDGEFVQSLTAARVALSHVVPDGDIAAVIERALEDILVRYGKRNGTVPVRKASRNAGDSAGPSSSGDALASGRSVSEQSGEPRSKAKGSLASSRNGRPAIPADLRRQVWIRDGGCCSFPVPDGDVCGDTWQLECDHIDPVAKGGATELRNLRLVCRRHNEQAAREVFGEGFMERYGAPTSPGRGEKRKGRLNRSGGSSGDRPP